MHYGILEKFKTSATTPDPQEKDSWSMWFFCFPSHNQNERKVRDMASYDIKTVMLDNHVEGLLPKGLAKQRGLAILTRLVVTRPSL